MRYFSLCILILFLLTACTTHQAMVKGYTEKYKKNIQITRAKNKEICDSTKTAAYRKTIKNYAITNDYANLEVELEKIYKCKIKEVANPLSVPERKELYIEIGKLAELRYLVVLNRGDIIKALTLFKKAKKLNASITNICDLTKTKTFHDAYDQAFKLKHHRQFKSALDAIYECQTIKINNTTEQSKLLTHKKRKKEIVTAMTITLLQMNEITEAIRLYRRHYKDYCNIVESDFFHYIVEKAVATHPLDSSGENLINKCKLSK